MKSWKDERQSIARSISQYEDIDFSLISNVNPRQQFVDYGYTGKSLTPSFIQSHLNTIPKSTDVATQCVTHHSKHSSRLHLLAYSDTEEIETSIDYTLANGSQTTMVELPCAQACYLGRLRSLNSQSAVSHTEVESIDIGVQCDIEFDKSVANKILDDRLQARLQSYSRPVPIPQSVSRAEFSSADSSVSAPLRS